MRVDNSYTKGDGELLPATLVYQITTTEKAICSTTTPRKILFRKENNNNRARVSSIQNVFPMET